MILDNSVIELGNAVDLATISLAAEACRANVIVLPDVLEDAAATVTSITEAFDEWATRFDEVLGEESYRFMVVPQGKTEAEFEDCAAELYDFMEEHEQNIMWGIPRNLVKLHGTREAAVGIVADLSAQALQEYGAEAAIPIHLLGFSDNVLDDIKCAHLPEVGGIDSAVPIRAKEWEKVASGELVAEPRGTWWDTARYMPWMADNLLHARDTFRSE